MTRRLLFVLAVVALVGVAVYFMRQPAAPVDAAAGARPGAGAQTSRQGNQVGDLNLESLERRDDGKGRPSRDVFRFQERRVEAAAPPRPAPRQPVEPVVQVPTGPPPPPPIPLRY